MGLVLSDLAKVATPLAPLSPDHHDQARPNDRQEDG
jgi:hypothetical protein